MRTLRWVVLIAAFCLMLYTCALPGDLPAGLDDDTGLAGTYTLNGIDPTGLEYSGTVVITRTESARRYAIEWIVTGGIQTGTGTLTGDRFSAEWVATVSGGGGESGAAEYRVEDDGRLIGTRTVDGSADVGTEEIFPSP